MAFLGCEVVRRGVGAKASVPMGIGLVRESGGAVSLDSSLSGEFVEVLVSVWGAGVRRGVPIVTGRGLSSDMGK